MPRLQVQITDESGNAGQGAYKAAPQSLTDGQRSDPLLDSAGNIRTNPGALSSSTDSVQAVPIGASHAPAAQLTADNTAGGTVIVAARPTRVRVLIVNIGTQIIDIDTNGGTPTYGGAATFRLQPGASVTSTSVLGIKGITNTATVATLTTIDEYM